MSVRKPSCVALEDCRLLVTSPMKRGPEGRGYHHESQLRVGCTWVGFRENAIRFLRHSYQRSPYITRIPPTTRTWLRGIIGVGREA